MCLLPDVCSASTSPPTSQFRSTATVVAPSGFAKEFRTAAIREVGVREVGGNNRGKRVEEYLASTGNRAGEPYCQAFVYCIASEVSRKLQCANLIPRTALASAARYGLQKTAQAQTKNYAKPQPEPPRTALVYWQYPRKASGHVDVAVQALGGGWVRCVSANSGRSGTARDGTGSTAGVNMTTRNTNHPLGRMHLRAIIGIA
ncbi:MAG: hypothetical protein JNL32_03035 [Candidatus Kapabacteria bacterium]|nr:hypothetical protein [Candidatus Kapabacteria bacterium]